MNTPVTTASLVRHCWQSGETISALAEEIRPDTPEDGYAAQAELANLLAEPVVGWKIAATAEAGRKHIKVDRPLAGRLYSSIVHENGTTVSLGSNRMLVAEAEIVLGLKDDLRPLRRHRSEQEVAAAVGTIHAGLEFPDSRFNDFTTVGTACLIADNACAGHFVLGEALTPPADLTQLDTIPTRLLINEQLVTSGLGSDALGGPLTALTWLVNTVNDLGITIKAGEFVTTGVTGIPCKIQAGDRLVAHIGSIAQVSATVIS